MGKIESPHKLEGGTGRYYTGRGYCGPYICVSVHEDERTGQYPSSDYDGTQPVWLGGEVDDESLAYIEYCLNLGRALASMPDPANGVELAIEAMKLAMPLLETCCPDPADSHKCWLLLKQALRACGEEVEGG